MPSVQSSVSSVVKSETLPISPVAARMAAEHNIDLAQIQPTGSRIGKEDVLAYIESQKSSPQSSPQRRKEGTKVLASPKARRLAAEQGIELAALDGSGPNGAVLAADVFAAEGTTEVTERETQRPQREEASVSSVQTSVTSVVKSETVSRLWQIMADRLTGSWTSVPHFYLVREVDATALMAWRKRTQPRVEGITFTDLLVKVVAEALVRHPRLNASWGEKSIITNAEINVGLAVAVEDGLLVPVIHKADQLRLSEIATRRGEVVKKAQAGKLAPADMGGGTFTISNLGMFGVDAFNAIVNPPQAAILAVGRIADRVVPVDGQPAVRPMMTLTLSCDHRVVDGARGAQFLATLADMIEDPLRMVE